MPQPKSIPPGKGGKPYGKRSKSLVTIWYGLTVHIICLKITSKIFKIVFRSQIPANYANSAQFACTVREFRKICTIRLTCYTLCFSHLSRQRTLRNSSKLRKFRAIHPHSPRITQNSHIFVNLFYIMFQASDHPQRTQENWSEPTRFRSIRPPITQITRIPCISQ